MNELDRIFIYFVFVLVIKAKGIIPLSQHNPYTHQQNNCYWKLRDTPEDIMIVHSLKQNCMQGSLTWLNPFGGLEVTFRLPDDPPLDPFLDKNAKKVFCYSIVQKHTEVKVDREINQNKNTSFRTLLSEDCIDNAKVKIYAESVPNAISNIIGEFTFHYVWRSYTPFEKCRKCSLEEINQKFCASQFVIKGKMTWMRGTHMNFHVTEVIRGSSDLINFFLKPDHIHETHKNMKSDKKSDKKHINHSLLRSHHFRNRFHSTPSYHQFHHRRRIKFQKLLITKKINYKKMIARKTTHHRQHHHQQQHWKHLQQKHRRHTKRENYDSKNKKNIIRINNNKCKIKTLFPKVTQDNTETTLKHSNHKDHKTHQHMTIIAGDIILDELNVACWIDIKEFEERWQTLVDRKQNLCLYKHTHNTN